VSAIETDLISALHGVRHAFLTRAGGVSQGIYASLNCGFGSKDNPAHVAENRRRAAAALDLPASALVTAYQTHSTRVVTVEKPHEPNNAPEVDAMVTDRPGIALGILTADCAPVLLADPEARVVGAAHAGWRGAISGIVEETVAAMTRMGAKPARILAAIGPCIGPRSYEVGPEFPAPFLAQNEANARYFKPASRADHYLFDLPAYVQSRLNAAGIVAVDRSPADTCAEPDRFFSYRRTVLDGQRDYGRLLSIIALED
jgi:YfiH family protein